VNDIYDIGIIRNRNLDIFKGYDGRVFGYGIRMKMVMCAKNKNL